MNPERKVEIKLWDWIKTKSTSINEVYFNSKNEINAPIFKVKGIQKKPDLIFNSDIGYIVVEVKDNSSSKNILRADKIIDIYFKNYIEKKTKYIINNTEIDIKYFLIATQDSINGFLFKNEKLLDNWSNESSKSKYNASKIYKIIPRFEGNRTFEFIRQLWHNYGKIRNNYNKKVGLGILISNTENNFNPYMMITNYNDIKKRWGQRWIRI